MNVWVYLLISLFVGTYVYVYCVCWYICILPRNVMGIQEDMPLYYPTALRRVQILPKTSTNITWYLYSRGPVRNSPVQQQQPFISTHTTYKIITINIVQMLTEVSAILVSTLPRSTIVANVSEGICTRNFAIIQTLTLNSISKLIQDHPWHPWITSMLMLRWTEPTHPGLSTLRIQRLFQYVSTMEGTPI